MQDVKLQIRITGMTSLINKRLENILQITSPDSKKNKSNTFACIEKIKYYKAHKNFITGSMQSY